MTRDAPTGSPAGSPADARSSELRALRLLTALIAATTLVASVAAGFARGLPVASAAPAGYRIAVVAAVAVPLVAGVVAPWVTARTLRALNTVTLAAFAALLVGFLLLALPTGGAAIPVPWFLTVTAAPVTAALVAWGRTGGWVTLGALVALVQVIRSVSEDDTLDTVANDTFTFFSAAMVLLLAGQLVTAARQFDRATALAAQAATRRSEDAARTAATERLRLLVHDELLSTLSLAARVTPALRGALARQAERARRLIRELPEMGAPDAADGFAAQLAALVAEAAPDARLETASGSSTPPAALAPEVAESLLAAARQALGNSVAHAGPGARRTVELRHDGSGVRLVVRDDGVGFDANAVPAHRMGVAESVLGRMRSTPGGWAELETRPGAGTTVTLGWRAPRAATGAAAGQVTGTSATAATATTASLLLAADPGSRRLFAVALCALLAAQTALAALAVLRTGEALTAVLAVLAVAAGFAVLGPLGRTALHPRRTAIVVALAVATAGLSWVPVSRDLARYGDLWYLASLAFVLVVLAMRGRPGAALAAAAGVAVLAFAGVVVQHNDGPDVVAATTRMLAIVGVGVGFVLGIMRLRARTLGLRRDELRTVRAESFRAASARELRARTRELERLIGGVLERLAGDAALDEPLRRDCVVLEGRLRDGYRAGRLARHPLIDAAAAARGRGVDVALFDDPDGAELDEAELDRIAGWLAARLDETEGGRFTGRILPAGRPAAASAADDVRVRELPHASP